MTRSMRALALAAALVATACGTETETTGEGAPSGRQSYRVQIDGPAPKDANLQVSAYFPGSIKARPGDEIVFDNASTQAIHTVTFGVKPDRSDSPAPETKGLPNPAVFGPCYAGTASPELTACSEKPPSDGPPAFAAKGYWNSGVLSPAGAPEGGPPRRATVRIGTDVAPGSYAFVCVLHPFMNGTLEVVSDDADRSSPADVEAASKAAFDEAVADGEGIATPKSATRAVQAGWGDRIIAVNRFEPRTIEIAAGEEMTWKTASPYEPHTVSFNAPFSSPEEPGAFMPKGVASGGSYTGGVAHSGLFGPKPFPTDTFSLRFPHAGTYEYICLLHPGMGGTVRVN